MGTVNLTSRLTLVLRLDFPDFSQEQVEFLLGISVSVVVVVVLVAIGAVASTTTAVGALGAMVAAFVGFPS